MSLSVDRVKVSVVTPCWNEEDNIDEIYHAVKSEIGKLDIDYEHLFIDNASSDNTRKKILDLTARDSNVKAIFNLRNFGPIRSPFYGLLQATGDAVILIAADFQEPPELIQKFVEEWRKGAHIVAGIKTSSEESGWRYRLRQLYYECLSAMSEVKLLKQFTGFALYDKQVVNLLRQCREPLPYLRGLISELGFVPVEIPFHQPQRERGVGKGGIRNLFNFAMLGLVNHSRLPLRASVVTGCVLSGFSLLIALAYLIYKLLYWDEFQLGVAPLVIGLFFFSSVQLLFLGIVGEYVGATLTYVRRRPLVVESERINFEPRQSNQQVVEFVNSFGEKRGNLSSDQFR